MPSVMAIVSKAVFEALPVQAPGSVVPLDRYTSKNPAFGKLEPGDSIFLVTVRANDRLLLVARLDDPQRKGESFVGAVNTMPISEISAGELVLADGNGITAKPGRLAMSLQTPRLLADADVARLRVRAPESNRKAAPAVEMKLQAKRSKASRETPAVKLAGGKISPRAQRLVEQIYKSPDDRALRGVLADQLLEDQHVWGELISLQLSDPAKHAERIRHIIRQHTRDLVGEIANVAAREDLQFEDGFLVAARCGKSKSFTRADQRMRAAIAPEWATVKTVTLTYEMPGTFVEALLRNPAASNLTKIAFDGYRPYTALARATPADPWEIASPQCESELAALPDVELARIPTPTLAASRAVLEAAREKRARANASSKKKKPKQPKRPKKPARPKR